MDSMNGEPEWMAQRACSPATADLFFERQESQIQVDRAKAICASCPVIQECLEYAIIHREREGIWGGKRPTERRKLWGAKR